MCKMYVRSWSYFTNRNFLARNFPAPQFILKWQKLRCCWNKKQVKAFWILKVRSRLNSGTFSQEGLNKLAQEEESFMTRQSGGSSTSAIPPNKRPVDYKIRLNGELCLTLSVGIASVIFIEGFACSKICVLRLPLILTCTQKTSKEIATNFHTNALLEVTTSCFRMSRGWKQSPTFWTGVQPKTDGMTPYGISMEQ